jgi:hypothetical protein
MIEDIAEKTLHIYWKHFKKIQVFKIVMLILLAILIFIEV